MQEGRDFVRRTLETATVKRNSVHQLVCTFVACGWLIHCVEHFRHAVGHGLSLIYFKATTTITDMYIFIHTMVYPYRSGPIVVC